MSRRTLYLYPDADWPQEHADCAWCLADAQAPQRSGCDAPAQWPAAADHVLVLPVDQLVYHTVKLPPGVRWTDAAALAMALEDRVVDDLTRLVVVPLRQHGEEVVCATLQRQRLEQLLACLRELGQPVARIESLADKLPPAPDAWRIFQNEDGALWLHDGRTALALDTPSDGAVPVTLALRRAQAPEGAPAGVALHGVAPELLQDLAAEWDVPVQRLAPLDWRSTLGNPAPNLLVGEWAPRHRPWREPKVRAALVVIAACAALQALAGVASLGRDWWSIRQVRAEQAAVWQEASGSAEPADQPKRRLNQLWQSARARVGESRNDEFVPMLAALAQQLPPSRNTTRLDFDQGRLIVVWPGSAVDARALEAGMRERGYAAVTQSAQNGVVTTALAAMEKP